MPEAHRVGSTLLFPVPFRQLVLSLAGSIALLAAADARAGMFYVSPLGSNSNVGTADSPWLTIQKGLDEVGAGDTLIVGDGTYNESLDTVRHGAADNRITIRAQNSGQVTVTNSGRVLDFNHSYTTFDGIRFDGQFGTSDTIRVRTGADFGTLTNVEVLNSSRDGIDLGTNAASAPPPDYLTGFSIQDSSVHDTLWIDSSGNRQDAHGIVAGGVRDFTLSNTVVFYVSGDAFQLQDGNWDNVLADSVEFWNGPLPDDVNGFAAGVNPGENAIDTKQDRRLPTRGRLTIRDSTFFGWNGELIPLASALVLKEKVDVTVERSVFHDNLIALRLRGETSNNSGALVTVKNSIFYDNDRAARFEDGITDLELVNNTFGAGHRQFIQDGGAGGADEETLVVRNNLFFGSKPGEAGDGSNLGVDGSSFVDVANNDYHLAPGSPAIDAGTELPDVLDDFDGQPRPSGHGYDVGADEFTSNVVATAPEPTTAVLLATGVVGLWLARRRRAII